MEMEFTQFVEHGTTDNAMIVIPNGDSVHIMNSDITLDETRKALRALKNNKQPVSIMYQTKYCD